MLARVIGARNIFLGRDRTRVGQYVGEGVRSRVCLCVGWWKEIFCVMMCVRVWVDVSVEIFLFLGRDGTQ